MNFEQWYNENIDTINLTTPYQLAKLAFEAGRNSIPPAQNPIEVLEDICPELKCQLEELKEYCNQDVEVNITNFKQWYKVFVYENKDKCIDPITFGKAAFEAGQGQRPKDLLPEVAVNVPNSDYEELKRLIVREAPHTNNCTVWVNDKGNIERCTCWKAKAFKILGVELNEN